MCEAVKSNGVKTASCIQLGCCLYRLTSDIRTQTESAGMKKFYANGNEKKVDVAILIAEKLDFKQR